MVKGGWSGPVVSLSLTLGIDLLIDPTYTPNLSQIPLRHLAAEPLTPRASMLQHSFHFTPFRLSIFCRSLNPDEPPKIHVSYY